MLIKVLDGTLVNSLTPGSEKRVRLRCDICGTSSDTTWANYQRACKISGGLTTKCRACACRLSAQARRGRPAWNRGKFKPLDQRKRTTYIAHDGYRMVYVPTKNSARGWAAYRKEHVIVAEQHMGRALRADEIVHHIDGNKLNNVLSNLWVAKHGGHRNAHQSLQEIGYALVCAGLVQFKAGRYLANQKLLELLGRPDADNQQPSRDRNVRKVQRLGSASRSEALPTSGEHRKVKI